MKTKQNQAETAAGDKPHSCHLCGLCGLSVVTLVLLGPGPFPFFATPNRHPATQEDRTQPGNQTTDKGKPERGETVYMSFVRFVRFVCCRSGSGRSWSLFFRAGFPSWVSDLVFLVLFPSWFSEFCFQVGFPICFPEFGFRVLFRSVCFSVPLSSPGVRCFVCCCGCCPGTRFNGAA